MMIKRGRVLAVLGCAIALGAWVSVSDPLRLAPESRLWVDGTSTVRSFTCKATVVDAMIETSVANAVPAVLGGENGVRAVVLTVPVAKLDCGNGQMNDHMLKALKAKDHAAIAFKLESYTLAKGSDTTQATLRGTLDLGGVSKPIVMEAALTPGAPGTMRMVGVYELSMKDYDLKPPSLMLGTLKVREKVKVGFDLTLR